MQLLAFKGIVHPKMKIQSSYTQPHADGKSGEVFFSRVLWTKKLHLTFNQHEGEEIMTEFSFLGKLSL